jgi:hypothetical protein
MQPHMGDAPSCVSGLHARLDCPFVRTAPGSRTGPLGCLAGPGRSRPGGGGLTWLLFRPLRCVVSAPRRRRRGLVRVGRQVQGVVGGPGRDRDRGWSRPRRTHTPARAYLGIGPDIGPAAALNEGQGRSWSRLRRSHTHNGTDVTRRRRKSFRRQGRPDKGGPSKE